MIKINLLPAYVLERHLVRRTGMLMGIVVIAQLAALGFAFIQLQAAQGEADARLKHWTAKAQEVSTVQSQANSEKSAAGPFQAWVDFVSNVNTNNAKWAWLYGEIAKWVDNKVVLQGIGLSGQTVTLRGATDTLESAKRWYLNSWMCYLYSDVKLQVQVPTWQEPTTTAPAAGGARPATLQFALGQRGAAGAQPSAEGVSQMTPPSERTPVTLTCTVKPQFLIIPPAPPTAPGQVTQGAGVRAMPGAVGAGAGTVPAGALRMGRAKGP